MLYTIMMLFIYRIGAHVPVPGVNVSVAVPSSPRSATATGSAFARVAVGTPPGVDGGSSSPVTVIAPVTDAPAPASAPR